MSAETKLAQIAVALDKAGLPALVMGGHAVTTPSDQVRFLSSLRSRRGFERALALQLMSDEALLRQALPECQHPVSVAFLLPFIKGSDQPTGLRMRIDDAFLSPLLKVEPGSVKHIALVEVVRRSYKRWAMETVT